MKNKYIIKKSFAILALTVSVAFTFVACAKEPQEPAVIIMTTKTSEVKFSVVGTGDIAIDWGDGKKSNTKDAVSFDDGFFVFSHSYPGTTASNIVITGNVTKLYCSNIGLIILDVSNNKALTYLDCRENQLTSLDVSRSTALTYLDCKQNRLIALDVSKNIALNDLECDHNQITKLDVSKNAALWALSCVDNQLTTNALNDLFKTLPIKTGTEVGTGVIFISYRGAPEAGNPGNRDCDRSIAEKRGWVFMTIK